MANVALLHHQPDGNMREFSLLTDRTLLGRADDCDIVLCGRLISRRHACIRRADKTYVIEDLGSRNGTIVNGRQLTGSWVLHDGDRIELGGVGSLLFVDNDTTNTMPHPPALGIWLDTTAQDAWVDGHRLIPTLSPAQFKLLDVLLAHADQICSRDDIAAAIWPDAIDGVSDEAIDALVKRVRARLGEVPGGQQYLATLRGRGLILRRADKIPRR